MKSKQKQWIAGCIMALLTMLAIAYWKGDVLQSQAGNKVETIVQRNGAENKAETAVVRSQTENEDETILLRSQTLDEAETLMLQSRSEDEVEVVDLPGLSKDEVKSEDVLRMFYAGADAVIQEAALPTEEEVHRLAEQFYSDRVIGKLVMADVNDSVNVRTLPDETSEKAGKLYKDCGGYIMDYTAKWTKIQSGSCVGWVSNQYLLFGDEAQALADEVGSYRATIITETLRVRKEASVDAGVYGLVAEGDVFEVIEQTEDWLVIDFEGAKGYINEEFVDIKFHLDYGETIAQIEAREAAEKAKKEAAKKKNQQTKKKYSSYAATASDVQLLGALIQCEAGNQPYEGKVAVGAVVMNRVRSSAYPNTIYGVIYAAGQFTPAGSGQVDRRLEKGVSASCIKAAEEALNGYSNVGNATRFRPVGNHDGIIIGGHVFW